MGINRPIVVDPEISALIPPLTAEEMSGLRDSLRAEGCRDSLVVWREEGILLDGHNRFGFCEAEGIPFHVVETSFPNRPAAIMWVIKNQLSKRNLTPVQRLELAFQLAPLLAADAEQRMLAGKSDPRPNLAQGKTLEKVSEIAGVSCETARKFSIVKERAASEIIEATMRGDISIHAAHKVATTISDPEKQKRIAKYIVTKGSRTIVREIRSAAAESRRSDAETRAVEIARTNPPLDGDTYRLRIGDFEEIMRGALTPGSVDAIITDPPYGKEYIDLYRRLAIVAGEFLKPGGHMLVMTGHEHLPKVMGLLGEVLTYQWEYCYVMTPGFNSIVFSKNIVVMWKPILWYTKGDMDVKILKRGNDLISSSERDKRFHKWGQNVEATAKLVERFSMRDQLVVDPFLGGGTTGVAAVQLGRRFLGIDVDPACVKISAVRLKEIDS